MLAEGHTKSEADSMKELADQTNRTAAETDKLNKFKEREAELQRMRAMKPEAEKDTQSLFSEFLGSQPGGIDKLTGQVAQTLRASGRGAKFTPEEEQIAAGYRRTIADAERVGAPRNVGVEQRLAELTRRLDEADFGAAQKIIGAAPTDRGARDTLRAMSRQFPGAFPKGFGRQMAGMEPEVLKMQDKIDEITDQQMQLAHDSGVKRREDAAGQAQADKETERLIANTRRNATRREQAATRRQQAAQRAGKRNELDVDPSQFTASRQQRAVDLELQVAQQWGKATPDQALRLKQLQSMLKKDMPTMQEAITMHDAVQAGMVSNQATFSSLLRDVRQRLAAVNQIGHKTRASLEQDQFPSGLPR
jgi:hypothetical protein